MSNKGKRGIKSLFIFIAVALIVIFCKVLVDKNNKPDSLVVSKEPEVKEEKIVISEERKNEIKQEIINEKDKKVIELNKKNCDYESKEEKSIKISNYKGNEDCIIIPKKIDGKKVVEIEKDAFKDCYNLETIKVPVELKDKITEITDFEVNASNSDDEYIELNTTKEYSDTYIKFMSLPEEVQEKSAIIPYKFEVSSSENIMLGVSNSSLPIKYDVRNEIPVEVENQGSHGTCYAYAALSSTEIWIAKNRKELVDFSEIHAGIYSNGSGGLFTDVENYINSDDGPVWETDWGKNTYSDKVTESQYNMINSYLSGDSKPDINSLKNLMKTQEVEGKIKSQSYLWPNIKTIKEHIMTYGSICAYYHHDDAYLTKNYKGYTTYYFHNGVASVAKVPNHAITIIGWDDNFPKEYFSSSPSSHEIKNNGAFLVLNSWGENWGSNGGYFWISYEDYWIDFTMTGVTEVSGLENNIKLNNMIIKDADTGIQLENINNMKNIVRRSIPIEVNLDLRYISNNKLVNQNELTITVRNPNENLNIKPSVTSKNGYIVFNIDTTDLSIDTDYIIDIEYNGEIISKSIRIISEYDYEIRNDNTIKLTAYKGADIEDIVVPETYKGRIVRELGSNLFYNNENLETLTIYSSIKAIGSSIVPEGVLLIGNNNSTTQAYAKANGLAFAKTIDKTITGDFWSFDIANRTLNINGVIPDYTASNKSPWSAFYRCVHKVNITTKIEKIGNYAFYKLDRLNSVSGTNNVRIIGNSAFYNCSSLEDVGNLAYITDVGDYAFNKCSSLDSVRLINTKRIGNSAFRDCTNLTRLGSLSKLETIEGSAFYNCTSLLGLWDVYNLTSIGSFALEGCTSLTYLENLIKIEKIETGAFTGCTSLEYVLNLNEVKEIGAKAFYGCTKLTSIGSLKNVKTIGSEAFSGCTKLMEVKSLDNVEIIGDLAFKDCSTIEDVLYLRNIKTIGWDTFNGCTGISKIYIGKTIQSIEKRAFEGCDLTIYGHANTRAETYAKQYNIPFEYIKVTGIEIKENPSKLKYIKGEELDLTNGIITVTYEDGTIEDISMASEGVEISGYNKELLEEQEVALTYKEQKTRFTVKVTNDVIKLQIKSKLDKLEYIKGEELDLTGGTITATYEDGTTNDIVITQEMVTGFDKTNVGEQTITITFEEQTITFAVKVTNDVIKLQIKSTPDKLEYIKGEELDLTGGILIATLQDGTTENIDITREMVTGFDKTNVAEQEVIVEYGGKQVIFTVKVTNDVTGIEIKETPNRTSYLINEELDLTGGTIFISYQDKTKEEISMNDETVNITGYDSTTLGSKELTVTYGKFEIKFIVKVTTPVTEVKIHEEPKVTYIKGEELDLTNGKILVTYEDGKKEEISLADKQVEVSGYDKEVLGEQNIILNYRGEQLVFKVEVTNNVTDIKIKDRPTKITYIKGQELDLAGGTIILTYQDKTTEEKSMLDEDVIVTGYDKTKVGKQVITVKYEEYEDIFEVEVTNNRTGMKISNLPSKTVYIKGEELDLTGGTIILTYQDTTTEEKSMLDEDVKVTGYDKTKVGKQVIKVKYREYEEYFDIEVTNNITSIVIEQNPNKTTYIKGEELNLTGGILKVIFEDGTTQKVEITKEMVTGYDENVIGEQLLTVTYNGKTVQFKVIVIENEIVENKNIKLSITQDKNSNKLILSLISDEQYISAIRGKIEYSDKISNVKINVKEGWIIGLIENTGEFSAYTIGGAKSQEIAEITYDVLDNTSKNLRISITNIEFETLDNQVVIGEDISQEILIKKPSDEKVEEDKENSKEDSNDNSEKILKEIVMTKKPSKKSYVEGDMFDPKGMVIMARYSDGTQKKITNYIYTPMGALTKNNNRIIISYTEGYEAKIIYYDVNVKSKEVIDKDDNINNNNNKPNVDNSIVELPGDSLPQTGIEKYIVVVLIIILISSIILVIFNRKKDKE